MRLSTILGLAASFTRKSKFKVLIVGFEFFYLAFKVIQNQIKKKQKALPVKDDTSA